MIEFFNEDIDFKLPATESIKSWLHQVILHEHHNLGHLNFIFCSDDYLLQINGQYLNHHYHTDVITFDLSESDPEITGDIFVSIDRVKSNAKTLEVEFMDELRRVMVHGVLHLLGYDDKSALQKQEMRKKEEAYLSL